MRNHGLGVSVGLGTDIRRIFYKAAGPVSAKIKIVVKRMFSFPAEQPLYCGAVELASEE